MYKKNLTSHNPAVTAPPEPLPALAMTPPWAWVLLLSLALSGPAPLASESHEYTTESYVEEFFEYDTSASYDYTVEKSYKNGEGTTLEGGNSSHSNTTLNTTAGEWNITEYNATTTAVTEQQIVSGGSGAGGYGTTSAYMTTDGEEMEELSTTPHTTEGEVTTAGQDYGTTSLDTAGGGGTTGDAGTLDPLNKVSVWYIDNVVHGEGDFIVVEGAMVQEAVQSLPSDSLCK